MKKTSQWKIPLFKINVTKSDINSVTNVIKRGTDWACGQEINQLENKLSNYIGTKYCLVFNSGTSAGHAVLHALNIKNQQVIVPSLSFIATANWPLMVGAKPQFCDIENSTLGMDPSKLQQKITKNTKVIMPIHYAGHVCDMKTICKIAKKNNLLIIEDAAQAFGAKLGEKYAGTFSKVAAFSLNPMKPLNGYGEGGVIVTNSKEIFDKIKMLRHAGTTSDYKKIITNNCLEVSLNHKMDSITAASILLSLKNYKIKKNKIDKLANIYEKKLTNKISFQKKHKNEVHARYVFPILSDNRDKLMNYLKANNIESKIFNIPLAYDAPVHRKYKKEKLVNAERLLKEILIIPCHDKMNFKQLNYVIKNINNFFKKK